MLTALTDRLYGVPGAVARFERAHPDEPVRAARACKAVQTDGRRVERGLHWAGARRGAILVTDQRVQVGPWELPAGAIARAEVMRFTQLGSHGAVLILTRTDGTEVQAGFTDPEPVLDALPVTVEVRSGALGWSALSILLRVLLMLWLGLWAYRALIG